MDGYANGTEVTWKWGNGQGLGKIVERFTKKVTRKIKGTEVTREATVRDPAYLIKQKDGDEVLKGHAEINKA